MDDDRWRVRHDLAGHIQTGRPWLVLPPATYTGWWPTTPARFTNWHVAQDLAARMARQDRAEQVGITR